MALPYVVPQIHNTSSLLSDNPFGANTYLNTITQTYDWDEEISFRKLVNLANWLALLLVCSGCGPSANDVVGAYNRKTPKLSETISLKSDQTFIQEVVLSDGSKLTTTGTWALQYKLVRLSSFYLTYDPETQKEMEQPQLVNSTDLVWKGGWLVRSEVGPYAFEKSK